MYMSSNIIHFSVYPPSPIIHSATLSALPSGCDHMRRNPFFSLAIGSFCKEVAFWLTLKEPQEFALIGCLIALVRCCFTEGV